MQYTTTNIYLVSTRSSVASSETNVPCLGVRLSNPNSLEIIDRYYNFLMV